MSVSASWVAFWHLLAGLSFERYHISLVPVIVTAVVYLVLSNDRYTPLPLVGHLPSVVGLSQQDILEWMLRVSTHFDGKPWRLELPTIGRGWFVNDPATLKYILTTEHTKFSKGRFFTDRTRDLFGSGILLATGDSWRIQRSAASVLISASSLESFGDEVLPNQLQVLLEPLAIAADTGEAVDLSEIAENFSLAVFGQLAFNSEWTDLKTGFSGAFKAASGRVADRFHLPLYSLFETFTSRGRRLRNDLEIIQQYTERMVRCARDEIAEEQLGKKAASAPGSGALLRALLEDDLGMTTRQIADCCLNLITAGVDTTAQALTWTFYLLLRHPRYLLLLKAELNQLSNQAALRTADLAGHLPCMKAVINESLRLQPPIPLEILENISGESMLLPNGRIVHPGEQIMWSAWVMARLSPDTSPEESATPSVTSWGDDPESFRPERWQEIKHKPSAYEWPVFHAGPRACLGQSLARLELVYALKHMLEGYDFEMAWDGGAKGVGKGLTAPIEQGLPVRVTRRK